MYFKELRKNKGETQISLANKLGIKQSTLAMWETGRSRPKTADLPKISEALGVSVEEIVNCFK